MTIERKYYSINEVSKMTGLSLSKLRYAERLIPGLNIHKIRSRRYYTKKNLEQLKKVYGFDISYPQDPKPNLFADIDTPSISVKAPNVTKARMDHGNILGRIDTLSTKLSGLSSGIVNYTDIKIS